MPIFRRQHAFLMRDLITHKYTAGQLATKYNCEVEELQDFVEDNREKLERLEHEQNRLKLNTDTNGLWVTSKIERLHRYQDVLEQLMPLVPLMDPMVIREIRSYLNDIADELGQLLNRGAGETGENTKTNYQFNGIDFEDLR